MKAVGRGIGFMAMFLVVFAASYAVLFALDLLPENDPKQTVREEKSRPAEVERVEEPIRIVARDIDLDAPVVNPNSKEIAELDKALLSGAVRYPGTALLGQEGTALLFGHSSYLPIVRNKMYKIFNGIEKFEKGDVISVYSGSREYRYEVVRVEQAKATADRIDLEQGGRFLKLVTCNSFGAKEDRFVVTASFVGAYEV